jgi:hypothetical protein
MLCVRLQLFTSRLSVKVLQRVCRPDDAMVLRDVLTSELDAAHESASVVQLACVQLWVYVHSPCQVI